MSDAVEELLADAYHARREHRFDDAKSALGEALHNCRHGEVPTDLARVLTALGQIERDLKNTEVARKHYEEAVAIYREHGEALRLAHSVRHVGDIYLEEGQFAPAETCYEEALKIYRANVNTTPLDLANTLRGFAILKQELAQNDEARQLWAEARDLYESVNVEAGVAESARRIAQLQN